MRVHDHINYVTFLTSDYIHRHNYSGNYSKSGYRIICFVRQLSKFDGRLSKVIRVRSGKNLLTMIQTLEHGYNMVLKKVTEHCE